MHDDPIQLPGFIIADLYKHALVEVESFDSNQHPMADENEPKKKPIRRENTPAPQVPAGIRHLGENIKNVLVLVQGSNAEYVAEQDLQFLTNILKACQLTLRDIAIINISHQPATFTDLKDELAAKHLLLFGVEPGDIKLPFAIPNFQVQQYAGCTIVTAPGLAELNTTEPSGKLLKTKLWQSLQSCFNL